MISPKSLNAIKAKFELLKPDFNERSRRLWAAAEANSLGYGGVAAVSKATGIAESTIRIGKRELKENISAAQTNETGRIRKKGGGRKNSTQKDKDIMSLLDGLMEPSSFGDIIPPLRWTCKGTRSLAQELSAQGHFVSHTKIRQLLADLNYSVQGSQKRMGDKVRSDRDAQFNFINSKVLEFHKRDQAVISLDIKEADYDIVQFSVHSIYQWWLQMGKAIYPDAKELLVVADFGKNKDSCDLWKMELQKLADKIRLDVSACHFPPGTIQWNKIEHRMSSFITRYWAERSQTCNEVYVNLIANAIKDAGLTRKIALEVSKYSTGKKISDKDMGSINLEKDVFHGNWNYIILSSSLSSSKP